MNLPRKLKEVVLLYYYHNLDTYDIADTQGIARSCLTVKPCTHGDTAAG